MMRIQRRQGQSPGSRRTLLHGAAAHLSVWLLALGSAPLASADPLQALEAGRSGDQHRLEAIQLEGDRSPVAMRLREVSPWAQDARIVVHGAGGEREMAPPAARFFTGQLEAEPGSRVMLRIAGDGELKGLVIGAGGTWMLDEDRARLRSADAPLIARAVHFAGWHDKPTEFTCSALEPPGGGSASKLDQALAGSAAMQTLPDSWRRELLPRSAPKGSLVTHLARIAVDTDHEYFLRHGNVEDAAQYMGDLFAYISGIYEDETRTALAISRLDLYETADDPWTQNSTSCALYELGGVWNTEREDVDRSLTHFVSGKSLGGGIAWLGTLCVANAGNMNIGDGCPGLAASGPYVGHYGVSAGITGSFNVDNPGVVWDLVVIAHEIGHNFNSPHTHCYIGVENNPNPVDTCYTEADDACHSGTRSLPGPQGQGSGTLMSYCHLLSGGLSNISATFGTGHAFGDAPERVPNRMRNTVLQRAQQFPACLAPQSGIRLSANPARQQACSAQGSALTPVAVQVESFGSAGSQPVNLSFDAPLPAGFSLGAISPNPVTPGSSAQVQLQLAAGAAAGSYSLRLQGSNGSGSSAVDIGVDVAGATPSQPSLSAPAAGAEDLGVRPGFSWQAVPGASRYRLQVSTSPEFTAPVIDLDVAGTSHTPSSDLQLGASYHWRVIAMNSCGAGSPSAARRFSTRRAAGQCAAGQNAVALHEQTFESGLAPWTASNLAGSGAWVDSTARKANGSRSAFSAGTGSVSDRVLTSPAIALPADADQLGLSFRAWMSIEANDTASTCFDAGVLEISTDGSTFSGVPASAIQLRSYDGVVSSGYSNPLAGRSAWCGDRPSFEQHLIDLSAYAGQTVRLRLRSASDSSASNEGWYVDDVRVLGCETADVDEAVFADGFE